MSTSACDRKLQAGAGALPATPPIRSKAMHVFVVVALMFVLPGLSIVSETVVFACIALAR